MKKGRNWTKWITVLAIGCFTVWFAADFFYMSKPKQTTELTGPYLTFIAPVANQEFWGIAATGAYEEGKRLGADVKCIGFWEWNEEKYIDAVRSAIYANVDGIIMAGLDGGEELCEVIEEAENAGIDVVLIDSDIEKSKRKGYVGTNNYEAGKIAGENLRQVSQEEAVIAVVMSSEEAVNQRERLRGFQDAIKECEKMKIEMIVEGDSNQTISKERILNMLKEYPQVNAFFCTEGYAALSVAQVIEDAQGQYDDFHVVTFAMGERVMESIQEDRIDTAIQQDPYEMGAKAVEKLLSDDLPEVYYTESKSIQKENLEEMILQKGDNVQWHFY